MALTPTTGIIHLPFGERPQYGSPYPEGIAVGFISQTGDGSGGNILATFNADAGFLYRLELMQLTRGSPNIVIAHTLTSHRWASERSGLGTTSFDLNWPLTFFGTTAFAVAQLAGGANGRGPWPLEMIRRLPIGRTDSVLLQPIITMTVDINVTAITHEFAVTLTYWRKEALSFPGFLSSFYEAPVVPTSLKLGA